MKVILSRKGFDSASGGGASPILPDGQLITLPIPHENDKIKYEELNMNYGKYNNYFELMSDLGVKFDRIGKNCHLDPDLNHSVITRKKGWKPLFGQMNGAQTHLHNQKVGKDDLFLFFGWFKQTEFENGKIVYKKSAHDLHVIYGYLQIDESEYISSKTNIQSWMKYHPHANMNGEYARSRNNTIYVANDKLSCNPKIPGAGVFKFDDELVLTKDGYSRSRWNLPECFKNANIEISHHNDSSWKEDYFQSACIGQEFVIKDDEKVEKWAKNLIEKYVAR